MRATIVANVIFLYAVHTPPNAVAEAVAVECAPIESPPTRRATC